MPVSSDTKCGMVWFISPGAIIGPSACCSSVSARPSQNRASAQARLRMVGERRPRWLAADPTAVGRRSPQDSPGLWHDEQDMVLGPDTRGSKNSICPRLTFASLKGLSRGYGAVLGRL